jgi:hypothetical protein
MIGIADSAKILKENNMELPANETQVAALSRLEGPQQAIAWQRVQRLAEQRERPITADLVHEVVDDYLEKLEVEQRPAKMAKEAPKSSLEEPDLDLGSDLSDEASASSKEAPALPSRIVLTEQGEEALEKIRRHCGEAVADAIEHLRLPISERELINWANDDDPNELAYYVADLRWSVSKAQGFVRQTVTGRTSVGHLVTLAMANKGIFETDAEGVRITVRSLSKAAA